MDTTQILFLHHYQTLVQREQQDFLSTALGIVWDKKNLIANITDEKSTTPLEKLFIPLSVAVNPEILDYVKKQFKMSTSGSNNKPPFIGGGEYMPKSNEVIHSLGDLPKNEFLKMIGKRPTS